MLVVANHLHGIAEGLAPGLSIAIRHQDLKLTVHGLLIRPPEAAGTPVDLIRGLCVSRERCINPKTMAKQRKRAKVPPKAEEAMVVAFRRHRLLLLDDRLYVAAFDPGLTRSGLYRCLQRRRILRLPDVQGQLAKAPDGQAISRRP